MSEIKQERIIRRDVTIAWKCDVCGAKTMDYDQYAQEWFRCTLYHHGWGNDSLDADDVCSVDCLIKILEESIPDLLEYADEGGAIAGMPVKFAKELLDRLTRRETDNESSSSTM